MGEFLRDPDLADGSEDFVCAICSHIATKPLAINCSHLFCDECLRRWVQTKRSCPTCKAPVKISKAVPNQFVTSMIEKLKFRCPNVKHGCTFREIAGVELRNVKAHLEECGFQLIACSLCDDKVLKRDLEDHQNNQCVERDVKCNKCDEVMKFRLLSSHDEDCQESEVSCDLCAVRVKRRALAKHDRKSVMRHLRAMRTEIRDLKHTKQQLQDTTQKLQTTTQELQKTTQQLLNTTEQLQHTTQTLDMFVECGDGRVYQWSNDRTEGFNWYCKDYIKGNELDLNSPRLTMKAGYQFWINAHIKDQQVGVYFFLDSARTRFPYPFTLQTARPLHSYKAFAHVLVDPNNANCFGPNPAQGYGSLLCSTEDLGDHPLLIRVLFHLDEKLDCPNERKM